jgi:23S rRNA (guanosine2251-2'-O)-methyltransferase
MRRCYLSYSSQGPSHGIWLYGLHAVCAALQNPLRQKHRLLLKDERLLSFLPPLPSELQPEIVDQAILNKLLGHNAVHQGLALLTTPLPKLDLKEFVTKMPEDGLVIVLDAVTDPHNVGAILRSAAAFGASAVLLTVHHSPLEESGVLAKAASGALEQIPLIRITNLARGLRYLQSQGFWVYGLDENGQKPIHHLDLQGRIALVLGAEGEGIRRLTCDSCDELICLPTQAVFATLNVSTSAAVALYEWRRQHLNRS